MFQHFAACTITTLLSAVSFAQDNNATNETKSLEELTAAVISAESFEVWDAYRGLFAAVHTDELGTLLRHQHASISLQAAWERAIGTLTDKEVEDGQRPHDQALNQFIGFVEGRTRMELPKWWSDFVLRGPVNAKQTWYDNAGQKFVSAPKGTTVSVDNGHYTLQIANDTVVMPDAILSKTDSGDLRCRMSGVFTPKHCFVAIHDDVGFPHNVACLDRATGKLIWLQKACGCWIGGASGVHESWVTVTVQDDLVVIFGASWTGFYLHAFEATTGTSQFKMSTVFSMH